MSDKQSNGKAKYLGPRYANGAFVPFDELDLIARAFGFLNAQHMNQVCAQADRRRAARKEPKALAS